MGDGGMTPLHSFNERGDQTPGYQTPRGDRTPLHEDGAKTPSQDVWLPQTPRHTPHTPRSPPESPRETDVEREIGELEGNSSSSTLNPVTPGLPTPSEHRLPSTPATPATPVDRRPVDEEEDLTSPAPSPIPQDVRDPRTPSNPATPVSTPIDGPRTPMETPVTPGVRDGAGGYTWIRGAVVETSHGEGVIVSAGSGGTCNVRMLGNNETHEVSSNSLTPIKAGSEKFQEVVVVAGDQHRGFRGVLMGTDPPDGILRLLPSEEIVILPLECLCKFQNLEA